MALQPGECTDDYFEALYYVATATLYRCRKCGEVVDFPETEQFLGPEDIHDCWSAQDE